MARLKRVDTSQKVDFCICQLSTNDASRKVPMDQIEEGIRFIVDYVTKTWQCPMMFYTSPRFENEHYGDMVELLLKLQKELKFAVLDFWNDEEMQKVSSEDYKRYMADPVHPTRVGYEEWWTPKFIFFCEKL